MLIEKKSEKRIDKADIIKWLEKKEKKVIKKENISERIDSLLYGAKNEGS